MMDLKFMRSLSRLPLAGQPFLKEKEKKEKKRKRKLFDWRAMQGCQGF